MMRLQLCFINIIVTALKYNNFLRFLTGALPGPGNIENTLAFEDTLLHIFTVPNEVMLFKN